MISVRRLGFLVILAAACSEATAPPTGGPLTGSWGTLPIPSGSYTMLSLQSGAGRLQGTAQQFGIASVYMDSFSLAGTYSEPDSSFTLTFLRGARPTAIFAGRWSDGS